MDRKYTKINLEDIKYKNMFIGEKVVNRKELSENLNASLKRIVKIGGYSNILKYFGLERPSVYHNENKMKKENLKEFIIEYLNKNNRLPMVKEIPSTVCSKEFITRSIGGYKKFISSIGLDYIKPITQAKTFDVEEEQIINHFKSIYKETPPTSRGLYDDYINGKTKYSYEMIKSNFNKYSTFLKKCGYEEFSNNIFSKSYISLDGHKCDSFSEKVIDDFLFENNINHEVHKYYKRIGIKTNRKYICDFLLDDNTVVEYFGLIGYWRYEIKMKEKIKVLEDNKMKTILIYPNDLNNLDEIFKDYIVEGGGING